MLKLYSFFGKADAYRRKQRSALIERLNDIMRIGIYDRPNRHTPPPGAFEQFCDELSQITEPHEKAMIFSGLLEKAISVASHYLTYLTELLKRGARLLPEDENQRAIELKSHKFNFFSIKALLIIYGLFPFNEFREEYLQRDRHTLVRNLDKVYKRCHNLSEALMTIDSKIQIQDYSGVLVDIDALKKVIHYFEAKLFKHKKPMCFEENRAACQDLMAYVYEDLEQKERFCHESIALMTGDGVGPADVQVLDPQLDESLEEQTPLLPYRVGGIN